VWGACEVHLVVTSGQSAESAFASALNRAEEPGFSALLGALPGFWFDACAKQNPTEPRFEACLRRGSPFAARRRDLPRLPGPAPLPRRVMRCGNKGGRPNFGVDLIAAFCITEQGYITHKKKPPP